MHIINIEIKNYRALEYVQIPLHQCGVLIGENDVGKTSVLCALERFFQNKKINDRDEFFKNNISKPIEITLSIVLKSIPKDAGELLTKDGTLRIKRTFVFDKTPETYVVKPDNSAIKCPKDIADKYLTSDNFHFIPVHRDLSIQFTMNKTALLGKLIRRAMHAKVEEPGVANSLTELEAALESAVEPPRQQLETYLREQLHNEAIGLKFADLDIDPIEGVSFNVRILDDKGAETPIENRGAGTQNNLIIALFRLIAKLDLGSDFVLAMEEPENSLHPKAQRQLFSVLQDISKSTQTVITTHSPIFIDRARFESNIFLTRTPAGNTIAKTFNREMLAEIRGEMDIRVSDALLKGGGNCALIVEGNTEEDGFPVFMEMLNLSEFQLGISIIKLGGSDFQRARTTVQLLGAYEIPCIVVLDRDAEEKTAAPLRKMMNTELKNLKSVISLKKGVIEDYYPLDIVAEIINSSFGPSKPVSEQMFDKSKSGAKRLEDIKKVMHECGANTSIEYFKTRLGLEGTKLMKTKGLSIDSEIKEIFSKTVQVATSPAGTAK